MLLSSFHYDSVMETVIRRFLQSIFFMPKPRKKKLFIQELSTIAETETLEDTGIVDTIFLDKSLEVERRALLKWRKAKRALWWGYQRGKIDLRDTNPLLVLDARVASEGEWLAYLSGLYRQIVSKRKKCQHPPTEDDPWDELIEAFRETDWVVSAAHYTEGMALAHFEQYNSMNMMQQEMRRQRKKAAVRSRVVSSKRLRTTGTGRTIRGSFHQFWIELAFAFTAATLSSLAATAVKMLQVRFVLPAGPPAPDWL